MKWFALILGGLVVYRLSLLISKESGPARIFRKLRRMPPPKSATKEGLSCPFCVSVYAAALVTWYEYWLGWIPAKETPLYWLGMSAVAIMINQQFTKT